MARTRQSGDELPRLVLVPSGLGWMAMRWERGKLARLTFGHDTPQAAWFGLRGVDLGDGPEEPVVLDPVHGRGDPPGLVAAQAAKPQSVGGVMGAELGEEGERLVREVASRLVRYSEGEVDDLRDIPLELSSMTDFRRRVTESCRAIPYGTTVTYAELARRVGAPRAARAVGNVMRTNPWPLVVPCHRVVGTGGGLGGYSAPSGLTMKQRLLQLEGAALPNRMAARSGSPPLPRKDLTLTASGA
jgi:O-6-methylguanine DNA methyltransferase